MNKLTAKALFIISLITITISCSDENVVIIPTETNSINTTNARSQAEALDVVNKFLPLIENDEPTTRSVASNRNIINSDSPVIVRNRSTRSTATVTNNDTLMYIYNFDDNKGFAIISANKATEPLIAIADSGNISSIEDIDNPGLAMFIRAAENYISTSVCSNDSNLTDTMYLENNTRKNVGIRSVHDTIVSSSISPKLSVKWEQGSVEGSYCPNGTAGCTTIAIFQAMSYFYGSSDKCVVTM